MQALGEYILSVGAAAFIVGILGSLMPKGPSKEILKLVCGLFLAFTVISPVSNIQIPELSHIAESWKAEGTAAAVTGEEMAREAARQCITQELTAYILDKAAALGLTLEVQVSIHEDTFHPTGVTLTGDASPILRRRLSETLREELGLTQEDIIWTGPD